MSKPTITARPKDQALADYLGEEGVTWLVHVNEVRVGFGTMKQCLALGAELEAKPDFAVELAEFMRIMDLTCSCKHLKRTHWAVTQQPPRAMPDELVELLGLVRSEPCHEPNCPCTNFKP